MENTPRSISGGHALRTLRNILAISIPVAGTLLVLLSVLLPAIASNVPFQVTLVVIGLVMGQLGTWRLATHILPNQRRYLALRAEVGAFLSLTRILNAQAIRLREDDTDERRAAYRETLDAIHLTADRIAEVAGRED